MSVSTGYINWNGESSVDYDIAVEKYPNLVIPERKVDVYSVPGRNGDIIMMQDAWENVTQTYEIYTNQGNDDGAVSGTAELANWLMSPSGYSKLYDAWDYDESDQCYRMAYFKGPVDIENLMSMNGRATLEFVCKPQRYLTAGQTAVSMSSSSTTVSNTTNFIARPIITLQSNSSATTPLTLTIGSIELSISTTSAFIINCEEQNCYTSAGVNMNSYVTLTDGEFPYLPAMTTTSAVLMDAYGLIFPFKITPNTWRL